MGDAIRRGLRTFSATVLAAALVAGSSGCAAQSCPGVYLNPVVHVDATAWVHHLDAGIAAPSLTAQVCVAASCVTAAPAVPSAPGDLVAGFDLPADKVPVRVQLTTSDGHSVDKTTTVGEQLTRPFGSGCGGREEIDLAVTKDGALVAGVAAPVS